MLKAGTCICPKCGKIFEMAYYYNAPSATGAVLHYSDKHKGYWIEPYFPGNPRRTADPGFSLRIISGPSPEAEGMPHSIRVLRTGPDGSRQELMMKHSCPECATNTVLYKNYGAFPLYVIALAGLTETGKSAWLTAVSNPSNLAGLSDAGYPCRIEPASFHGSRSPAESTAAGSLGKTTYLIIRDRENRGLAGVLLRDFSGELFAPSDRSPSETGRSDGLWQEYSDDWALFARQGSQYSGPDLFFIVDNAMRQDNKSDQETAAFNALRSNTDLAGRPIGLILTHVDQLMDQEPADPADPTGCVPLISRRTFPQGTGYRPAQMNARLALEHYLVTRTHSLGRYLDGQTGFRGFMVKSCEKEGGIQNFDSPINVLDPLVWALNTLGIFPLPDTQTDQA